MRVEREAEQAARLADQQRVTKMFQYIHSLGAAQGFSPPPPLLPPADSAHFHTHVSIEILILYGIYSSSLAHSISSLCRDNRRHQTTLIDCSTHRQTNPAAHLVVVNIQYLDVHSNNPMSLVHPRLAIAAQPSLLALTAKYRSLHIMLILSYSASYYKNTK